jgi:hypothetical protein
LSGVWKRIVKKVPLQRILEKNILNKLLKNFKRFKSLKLKLTKI